VAYEGFDERNSGMIDIRGNPGPYRFVISRTRGGSVAEEHDLFAGDSADIGAGSTP
jgi:hypothetical protein